MDAFTNTFDQNLVDTHLIHLSVNNVQCVNK